jgi:hypothetical protein
MKSYIFLCFALLARSALAADSPIAINDTFTSYYLHVLEQLPESGGVTKIGFQTDMSMLSVLGYRLNKIAYHIGTGGIEACITYVEFKKDDGTTIPLTFILPDVSDAELAKQYAFTYEVKWALSACQYESTKDVSTVKVPASAAK